jgi:predicted nucleic acid-binding protein
MVDRSVDMGEQIGRQRAGFGCAATALVHGLIVVTRNRADFAPMAVTVLNPWK